MQKEKDVVEKKKGVIDYIKAHPAIEWALYAVVAAVALLIFFGGSDDKNKDAPPAASAEEYVGDEMETRLAAALSQIAGAGEVEVLISYEASEEIVPALDVTEQSAGGVSERPVTIDGINGEGAMVLVVKSPVVRGAIIVAQGAHSVSVRLDLLRAAQAILSVPASRIEVFPMETGGRD